MNILQPWNAVFFAALLVYVGIRHVFSERAKSAKKTSSQIDTQERVLVGAVLAASLLPIVFLFTPLLAFADYQLPAAVPWFGATAIVAALWLFWRSHADLGSNWSVSLELSEEHVLVSHGVYRLIRHPMYAAIWLWNIGQGMLLQNWLAGWAVLLAFAALYLFRVPREEQMMRTCFGEEYQAYMQKTGRILPRL